jgi:hypothetical protein
MDGALVADTPNTSDKSLTSNKLVQIVKLKDIGGDAISPQI